MSSSFKYLDNDQVDLQQDKAQSFLDEKLAKNKHTIKQEDTGSKFDPSRYSAGQLKNLDDNGGPTVANATGDGNTHDFTSQYEDVENKGTLGGAGDLAARYEKAYGSKVGDDLQTNDQGRANEIYSKIRALESDEYWAQQDLGGLMKKAGHQEHQVNIGNYTKDGGLAVDASITGGINFDNIQSQIDENDWNGEKLNSINQLGSALLAAGGTGGKDDETTREKIEHSPEIQQAKERVRTYENDVLSGKVSEDIYDPQSKGNYTFDATLGSEGIGTPLNGSRREQANLATDSFLDNKKEQVKKKYEFQAR